MVHMVGWMVTISVIKNLDEIGHECMSSRPTIQGEQSTLL
jgi:hypothetical protein